MSKRNKKHHQSGTPRAISLPDGKTMVSSGASGALTIRQGGKIVTIARAHQLSAANTIIIFEYGVRHGIGELPATLRFRTGESGVLHVENAPGGLRLPVRQLGALLTALERLGCPMPARKDVLPGAEPEADAGPDSDDSEWVAGVDPDDYYRAGQLIDPLTGQFVPAPDDDDSQAEEGA